MMDMSNTMLLCPVEEASLGYYVLMLISYSVH